MKNGKQVRGRVRLEALTNLDMKFGLYPLVKVGIIESSGSPDMIILCF